MVWFICLKSSRSCKNASFNHLADLCYVLLCDVLLLQTPSPVPLCSMSMLRRNRLHSPDVATGSLSSFSIDARWLHCRLIVITYIACASYFLRRTVLSTTCKPLSRPIVHQLSAVTRHSLTTLLLLVGIYESHSVLSSDIGSLGLLLPAIWSSALA